MKTFITSLAVLFIGTAVTYYLNRRSPDVRYQLSSPIPMASAEPKNVQQLEVVNLGNAPAQKVQVHIRKKFGDVTVVKDSEADAYKQYMKPDGAELVYDVLPPGRTFKLILTFGPTTLAENDLTVKHQDGVAGQALSSRSTVTQIAASALTWFLLLLYMGMSGKSMLTDVLWRKARFEARSILDRSKPFYLSDEDWKQIRRDAVEHLDDPHRWYLDQPRDWAVYRFLDQSKPKHMREDEWHEITKSLGKRLQSAIAERVNTADLEESSGCSI